MRQLFDFVVAVMPIFIIGVLPSWALIDLYTRKTMHGHRTNWLLVIVVFNFFGAAYYLIRGRHKYEPKP
ncbi:MAG: Phospholipase D-nuclease N-terminal [Candidatus Saccharibacteria bacterium]|jgi:hypothetical protein|nr:Phospholipase D-nuclease N-terminal [Candidatus Saccharibacteria bacterium]